MSVCVCRTDDVAEFAEAAVLTDPFGVLPARTHVDSGGFLDAILEKLVDFVVEVVPSADALPIRTVEDEQRAVAGAAVVSLLGRFGVSIVVNECQFQRHGADVRISGRDRPGCLTPPLR